MSTATNVSIDPSIAGTDPATAYPGPDWGADTVGAQRLSAEERVAQLEARLDAAERAAEPEGAPYLGPYLGLVGAVLCSLAGALLLLAPFAFDYRQGAGRIPRSTEVDLMTGGGVLLVGVMTATMFGATMVSRLRGPEPEPAYEPPPRYGPEPAGPGPEQLAAQISEPLAEPWRAVEPEAALPPPAQPEPEPEPEPAAEPVVVPAPAPEPDPANALRDLLTPLVAALAADLRARDGGPADLDKDRSAL